MKKLLTSIFIIFTFIIIATSAKSATAQSIPQLSGGGSHSIGLVNDGTVWTWGSNSIGQFG